MRASQVGMAQSFGSLSQHKPTSLFHFAPHPTLKHAFFPNPRALKVSRKAEILSPLGALYYNTGRYEEALQVYREAAALQPSNKDIRLALVSVGPGQGLRGEQQPLGAAQHVTEG